MIFSFVSPVVAHSAAQIASPNYFNFNVKWFVGLSLCYCLAEILCIFGDRLYVIDKKYLAKVDI